MRGLFVGDATSKGDRGEIFPLLRSRRGNLARLVSQPALPAGRKRTMARRRSRKMAAKRGGISEKERETK